MTNYSITNNDYFKSIEISFTEKPSEQIRNVLKALRFRWHYTKKVWYGYANKQELISRLDAFIKPVKSEKKQPVKKIKTERKTETKKPENVQPVKAETKTEKAVNPFLKPKTAKVKRAAGKLKADQEKALLTLVKYNYIAGKRKIQQQGERRIFTVKDNKAIIGNPYAVVKINIDLLTEETKKQLEELSKESHVTYDGIEKLFNNAVKIQGKADPLTLENMTVEDSDGVKLACFKTGLSFNYALLKDVCRCFNYNVTIKAVENMKPALIEGEGFAAIVCGVKRY